ncbi:uncharacterized protein LOC142336204 isoform X3 [Convolutriloba macropyga]|uniref:uncharacterized protein LOC142336204 isoform X3 n=1 Tax=Convolutriloba macropyga TaxID=536237 RepID=UPI003F528971
MQKAPFILWEISMLLPCMVWTRFSRVDERECLNIHNCNRVSVTGLNDHFLNRMDEPCDMKEMLWSPCLAQMAQIHADSEILEHWDDPVKFAECAGVFGHKRWDFSTGQNIWWSPSRREPCGKQCAEAVGSWRSEVVAPCALLCAITGPLSSYLDGRGEPSSTGREGVRAARGSTRRNVTQTCASCKIDSNSSTNTILRTGRHL